MPIDLTLGQITVICGLALFAFATAETILNAPTGFEDEDGFHLGTEPGFVEAGMMSDLDHTQSYTSKGPQDHG